MRVRKWLKRLVVAAAILFAAPPVLILVGWVVPPPATPLMVIRWMEGEGWERDWIPLDRMDPDLIRAAIASEDARFCKHFGFDLEALESAWTDWRAGKRLRGGSTISQQTAKNLFLWPNRDLLRKGLEAYVTLWLEALWSKERILEVYLNVIEFGPGVYGAEAAARHWFGESAADLTPNEAARLIAILPNPRERSASNPSDQVRRRAAAVERWGRDVDLPESGVCP